MKVKRLQVKSEQELDIMNQVKKRTIYYILSIILTIGFGLAGVLYALRYSIDLYYSPKQVYDLNVPNNKKIMLGGFVKNHSIHRYPNSLEISFWVTDFHKKIKVIYSGLLPSLFREKQGVIAKGYLTPEHVFIAQEILAKHDENYHPPTLN